MASVGSLKNLGPYAAERLAEVGIHTADELRDVGAPLAYRILQHRAGKRVSLLFLYAMAGALEERDYRSYSAEEKAALREAAGGQLSIG